MSADATLHNTSAGCPPGWQEASLGSVADIRFSNVDKKSEPGEVPVRLCNYTDVYSNDYVTADMEFMRATATRTEIDRFGVRVGDVIITKDSETPNDIGVPAIIDSTAPDLVCGYHLAMIRPDPNAVDPTFCAKQLADWRIARYFGQQANGTTRYGLSTASIANVVLRLPPVEQQRAASRIVRLLDAAIAQADAVIGKLKSVRAGLLHDLLTRGLDHNGHLRPPPDQAPHLYKDSPLGKIPREWDAAQLGAFLAATEYGISSSLSDSGRLPVLRMNNFAEGEAVVDDLRFAVEDVPERLFLRHGDVLFNRTNSYEHVGRTGIWRGQLPHATFASYLIRLNPIPERLRSELLNLILNLPESQIRMRRFATPAVQQVNINPTQLQLMAVAAPSSLEEQDSIVRRWQQDAAGIASETLCLGKLRALRSGLASDLLTGRVRAQVEPSDTGA